MVRHDGHGPQGILLQPAFVAELVAALPDSALPNKCRMKTAHTWESDRDLRAIALMRHARKLVPMKGSRNKAKPTEDDLILAGQCLSNVVLISERQFDIQSPDDFERFTPAIASAGQAHPMHEHILTVWLTNGFRRCFAQTSEKFEALATELLAWAYKGNESHRPQV